MHKKAGYITWAGLFILCAGLGFVPAPEGILRAFMTVLAGAFFLPPAFLLYKARKEQDGHTVDLIRNLSALSLGLTLVLLVLNFVLAVRSERLGTVLHYVLAVISAPMMCSGYWVLSLFLWACLLMGSLKK